MIITKALTFLLFLCLMAAPLMSTPESFVFPLAYIFLPAIVALLFSNYLFFSLRSGEKIPRLLPALLFLAVSFSVISFTSALLSDSPLTSLKRYGIVLFITISVLMFSSSKRFFENSFAKMSDWISLYVVFLTSITILVYFFGVGHGQKSLGLLFITIEQPVVNGVRAAGFWGNPNTFSSLLFFSTPFLIYSTLIRRLSVHLFFFLMLIVFVGHGISLSRAGLASFFIFIFIFLFFYSSIKTKLILVFVFSVISIFFVVSIIHFTSIPTSYLGITRLSEISLSGREVAWIELIKSSIEHYAFGVGFGVSQEVILEPKDIGFPAHNVYLMILSEVGIVGFFLMLLFMLAPVLISWAGLCRAPRNSVEKTKFVLFFSFFVSVLAHQFFETHLFRYNYAIILWLCLFGHLIVSFQNLLMTEEDFKNGR